MTTRTTSASTARRIALIVDELRARGTAAADADARRAADAFGRMPRLVAVLPGSGADRVELGCRRSASARPGGSSRRRGGDGFAVCVFSQATCSGACFARRLDGYPDCEELEQAQRRRALARFVKLFERVTRQLRRAPQRIVAESAGGVVAHDVLVVGDDRAHRLQQRRQRLVGDVSALRTAASFAVASANSDSTGGDRRRRVVCARSGDAATTPTSMAANDDRSC